jgi:hypothetical protein
MDELKSQIAETLDEAEWEWLKPHFQRDTVIFVTGALDLLDVGVAIASDNTNSVKNWIDDALIYKPTDTQREGWDREQNKRFNAVIVQPYVLVQEIAV